MADDATRDDLAPRRIQDARTLRALSHPLRLKLLAELALRSPQNVTMLAERVGEAPNSVSYHLSQLLAHDLVQRTEAPPGATRRERWFEAASPTGYTIEITEDTPDQTATVAAVRAWTLQTAAEMFDRALANEPEARRRGLPIGSAATSVWLTEQEAHDLLRQVNDLLGPLARKRAEQRALRADPSARAGRVHYTLDLSYFPDFSEDPIVGSFFSDDLDREFGEELRGG